MSQAKCLSCRPSPLPNTGRRQPGTIAFSLAALLLTLTPGLDTMFVVRTAMASGARVGLIGGLGVCLGTLSWATASAAGVTALLAASSLAYNVLRIVGAAYLTFVGVRMLWASRPGTRGLVPPGPGENAPASWRTGRSGVTPAEAFRTGLLTNLLNPKVGVFYLTLLPQFIPAHAPVFAFSLLLASIHAVEGIAWFAVLVAAMSSVRQWLKREGVRRGLDRLTALVFIGFGARLVVEGRRL
jgi:threonine/homoserine/homoserine lactone efflux protein